MTCKICGKQYKYCPSCPKDWDKPEWMISFDAENCKTIFDTLVAYTVKKIDREEAEIILDDADLTVVADPDAKNLIDEIMGKKK